MFQEMRVTVTASSSETEINETKNTTWTIKQYTAEHLSPKSRITEEASSSLA